MASKSNPFLVLLLAIGCAACAPISQERVVPKDPVQSSVGSAWTVLSAQNLHEISIEKTNKERVLKLFWLLLDPQIKWIKEPQRHQFLSTQKEFEAAVKGVSLSDLEHLASALPGPKDAARWHVYTSWINAVARSWDPLASFYPPTRQDDVALMVKASMQGPGIDIVEKNGSLEIYSVDPQGPAFQAGLRPGSKVLSILDGSEWLRTQGMTSIELEDAMRGKVGDKLKIKVESESGDSTVSVMRSRWVIDAYRPFAVPMGKYQLVRVSHFYQDKDAAGRWSDSTEQDLDKILNDLDPQKPWLLDLRNNPGGILDQALESAALLGVEGRAWTLTNRHATVDVAIPHRSYAKRRLPDAVWVDHLTGSSAEALTGILMERGVLVVGEPTFGKTTLQMLFPLDARGYSKEGFSKTGFLMMSSAHASWVKGKTGAITPSCNFKSSSTIAAKVNAGYFSATQNCLKKRIQ